MEIYKQTEDLIVIGVHVKTFPDGIKEAFDGLIKNLGRDRNFYGISWMDENANVQYFAMAEQIYEKEAEQHNYVRLTVAKGGYKSEAIHHWMDKTDCIKDVFHRLMSDKMPGKDSPCIEWYKSDEEMLCMIKTG